MTGAYTEVVVKRKATPSSYAAKAALILGIFVFIGCWLTMANTFGSISIFLAIGMVIVTVVLWPSFNVVYEYVYCDGQIDFDKISGGEKRKRMLRVDLDNCEIMAPENSSELNAHKSNNQLVEKDFSSLEPNAKKYMLVASSEKERVRVIFEPSEEMLELAKQKAPRKVFLDGESGKPYIQ